MALTADSLLDRLRLKSALRKWRLLAITAAVIAALAFSGEFSRSIILSKGAIARVAVNDLIMEDRDREALLASLAKDKRIKAVIVHINSPGGTVVGGEILYHALRDIAAKKPVVSVMGSVAASGGYMTALGADYIFAREGTITGSIGVILQTAEVTELAKKLGINFLTFKSGPLKATPSPFEKVTPEVEEAIEQTIQENLMLFVNMVAERRQLPKKEVLRLADGRIFTGSQALRHKLIDAIGGEQEAIKWLEQKKNIPANLPVEDAAVKENELLWKKMLSAGTTILQKMLTGSIFSLDGLLAIWHPAD